MKLSTQQVSTQKKKLWFLAFVLWLLIVVSGLSVVYTTYDTRVKFNELESLRHQYNRMQMVWGQYLLEQSTWANYGRVEKVAAKKLSMKVPTAEQIILIRNTEAAYEG